ncbi:MAG: diguanylate cyclase [Deltaproteobacteria bacterium]|nr:diguanylate cyclase [Deltaproteobacteria bacterium]
MKKASIDYSKEHLLVLEKDPHFREELLRTLSFLGFKADPATSVSQALEMLKENQFTFLLSDLTGPDSKRLKVFHDVVLNHPEVSVLVMTTVPKGYPYKEVISAGASDFVKKPFEAGELEAKVQRIILDRDRRAELSELSITDSLTGLYNQRHFYTRLKEELARAKRQFRPFSLILLDLDDFKAYNDTYGHFAGDEVLRSFGGIISNLIREGADSGYRYGGDEFAIILTEADRGMAEEICRRIEKSLEEKEYNASMGYSTYSTGMTVKGLVEEADKALYKSKLRIPDDVG